MIKTFVPMRCRRCNIQFQPVDWMQARRLGFCDSACAKIAMQNKVLVPLTNADIAALSFVCDVFIPLGAEKAKDVYDIDEEGFEAVVAASLKLNSTNWLPAPA